MSLDRRDFLATAGAFAVVALGLPVAADTGEKTMMYGLIGKMTAAPGKRDELVAILLEGIDDMPGCLSYVVAHDPADADGIWITEVWDSEASHKASLSLPAVKQAIARGKPLIAGFSNGATTAPIGGHGL
ncbi:MAG TPA: putative quinol monooxygenase [Luteimonas sp.]|nr:putative quinol monooxygenase [Luteimonas sp.]